MQIGRDALDSALQNLRNDLADEHASLDELLEHVTSSVLTLFGLTGAGLLMLDADQALRTVLATDDLGWRLEEAQEATGEGPCIQSVIAGEVVATTDVTDDERWPALAGKLSSTPIGGVLGVPVRVGGLPVGALNVYVAERHDWHPTEIVALEAYGRTVEMLLGTALVAARREELASQLQHALDNRVDIERAVGVLMERHGIDAVTAFNRLRDEARPNRVKVVEVARSLLHEIAAGRR